MQRDQASEPPTHSGFVRGAMLIAATVGCAALVGCDSKTFLMPTPNAYTHPEWNPFEGVPAALQGDTVSVMYVTDRVPTKETPQHWEYGYGRSRSAAFGDAAVRIGTDKSWEELVAASRRARSNDLELTVTEVNEQARFEETPPTLVLTDAQMASSSHAALSEVEVEAEKKFIDELSRRLSMTPRKEVFVYIHGFADTFDDAVLTTAELWHFLGREGVPFCYTWPASIGLLNAYEYTLDSTEFTIYHLKQTLRLIASHPEVRKIHIIGHSRGTAVAMDAVRELYLEGKATGDVQRTLKLGTVVLAAPDIDLDVVIQRDSTERIGRAVDRAVVYFCDNDRALGLSSWLFGGVLRMGDLNPDMFSKEELEVLRQAHRTQLIEAKVTNLGDFNHNYFHENPAVSSDLMLLLRCELEPGAEHGRPLSVSERGSWAVENGYPGTNWTLPKAAEH